MSWTRDEVRPGVFVERFVHDRKAIVPVPGVVSRLAFAEKFTDAELEAVLSSNSGMVKVFLKRLDFVGAVDLGKQSVIDSVNFLEQVGIIAQGRAAEILGSGE